MKLEDQIVSRELSKRMEELGFPQESLFYWDRLSDCPDGRKDWRLRDIRFKDSSRFEERYSAYTTAELGEFIPVDTLNLYIYRRGDMTAGDTRAWTCELRDVVGIIIRT